MHRRHSDRSPELVGDEVEESILTDPSAALGMTIEFHFTPFLYIPVNTFSY
jgi:hypothetical protein